MIRWFWFFAMSSLLLTSQVHAAADQGEADSVDSKIERAKQCAEEKKLEEERQKQANKEEVGFKIRDKELENCKDEISAKIYKLDVVLYKEVQKLAKKFYDPVFKQEEPRGGQVRLHQAVLYLNELVQIHREEDYGTVQKMDKLFKLIKKMKTDLADFKKKPLIRNDVYVPFESALWGDVLDVFKKHWITRKHVKSFGGNIGFDFIVGGGLGASCGWTKDDLGERNIALFGQLYGEAGILFGPSIKVGYYRFKVKNPNGVTLMGGCSCGLGVGGSILLGGDYPEEGSGESDEPNGSPFNDLSEVGIGLLTGLKLIALAGGQICPLPTDWKAQREKFNINPSGHPHWFRGKEVKEIRKLYPEYKETYKEAWKHYLKNVNCEVVSNGMDEERIVEAA